MGPPGPFLFRGCSFRCSPSAVLRTLSFHLPKIPLAIERDRSQGCQESGRLAWTQQRASCDCHSGKRAGFQGSRAIITDGKPLLALPVLMPYRSILGLARGLGGRGQCGGAGGWMSASHGQQRGREDTTVEPAEPGRSVAARGGEEDGDTSRIVRHHPEGNAGRVARRPCHYATAMSSTAIRESSLPCRSRTTAIGRRESCDAS